MDSFFLYHAQFSLLLLLLFYHTTPRPVAQLIGWDKKKL